MNRLLWYFRAVVLAALIASPATKAVAQPTSERVLVVGVSKGRGSDARLVKGLGEHLQQSGMLLAGDALSAQDRACESPDCIEVLAKRAGAQLVLTAQLQETPPSTIFITMALFDVVRRAPFQETALCDQCNQEALIGKLSDVADKLIKQSREARQNPVRSTQPLIVPTVPPLPDGSGIGDGHGSTGSGRPKIIDQSFFARLSHRQKVAAGVLGGLAGAALIASIALTATDGQDTTRPCMMRMSNHGCSIDNVPWYATGYALTGALMIGVGFSLFWPDGASKSASAEVH